MAQTADDHHNKIMMMPMLMLTRAMRAMGTAKAFMIAIGRWNKLLRLS
jgi:hypothetical protein